MTNKSCSITFTGSTSINKSSFLEQVDYDAFIAQCNAMFSQNKDIVQAKKILNNSLVIEYNNINLRNTPIMSYAIQINYYLVDPSEKIKIEDLIDKTNEVITMAINGFNRLIDYDQDFKFARYVPEIAAGFDRVVSCFYLPLTRNLENVTITGKPMEFFVPAEVITKKDLEEVLSLYK